MAQINGKIKKKKEKQFEKEILRKRSNSELETSQLFHFKGS